LDKITFFPFFIIKDLFGILIVFFFYFLFVFFFPEYLNHTDNSILANPLVTPPHIVPEWYFLPFYGVLKTILNKLYGVVMMFASILVFLLLPYLDVNRIKGNVFVPRNRFDFWGFTLNFICLGYVGIGLPVFPFLQLGTIASHIHFSYFFIFIPSSSFYSE
jgi:quinol-cytochrome oxidoreductase complex cytochrome b subunit